MRPTGTELKTLQELEGLVMADHIALSHKTGASPAYTEYLLRDLAKYNYVEKEGKLYRLTPQGRGILEEKHKIQEQVTRFQEGIQGDWFKDGVGLMVITQLVESNLKIRAMVEMLAQKAIIGRDELRDHLTKVVERDWNDEVNRLLPDEFAEVLRIESKDEQLDRGLGWMVITQTIENKLKLRAIAEMLAQEAIIGQDEMRDHLVKVVERDWNDEMNKLLPGEEIEGLNAKNREKEFGAR